MLISRNKTRRNKAFSKKERLCSRKAIEALFNDGNRAFSAFPLRVVCAVTAMDVPSETGQVKVLFSVSKRHFKRAVDRNRAKRQMREAWRHNRDILPAMQGELAFIWLADEPQPSILIQRKLKNLLHRIAEGQVTSQHTSKP